VLQAQLEHTLEGVGTGLGAAGDVDHSMSLIVIPEGAVAVIPRRRELVRSQASSIIAF
jgi:hypothetical protein